MIARFAAATLAVAALAFAGCGGDDDEPSTVTETTTVSTDTAATDETTSATSTTEDGDTPAADIVVKEPTGFSSPTGNIGCFIDRSSVRCDVSDRDWEPPKRPADCEFDYGQGIELQAGAAPQFVCAGDTTLGAGDPLAYGESISAGLLRCESAESGMTCTDSESGRSFTISKESYDLG